MTVLDDLIELHRKLRETQGASEVEVHAHSFDALASELKHRGVEVTQGPDGVPPTLFGIPVVFDDRMAMGAFELRPTPMHLRRRLQR
jgi:hypothetical protein